MLMTNQPNNYILLTESISDISVKLNEKETRALGSTHRTKKKLEELELAKRMIDYICTKSRIDNPMNLSS